jgi:hypothetical protein
MARSGRSTLHNRNKRDNARGQLPATSLHPVDIYLYSSRKAVSPEGDACISLDVEVSDEGCRFA